MFSDTHERRPWGDYLQNEFTFREVQKATLNRSLIFIRVSHTENSTHQFKN